MEKKSPNAALNAVREVFMKIDRHHYDVFIVVLSMYVFVQLSIEFIVELTPEVSKLFSQIDFMICLIFIADWLYFLVRSKNKWAYAKSRIFEFVSSLPFLPSLRFLRILRVMRFFRGFRGLMNMMKYVNKNPLESALMGYGMFMVSLALYCSLAFYKFELLVNNSINSYPDALWLTYTTLTTIGYGDVYPITTESKLIAVFLSITGIGFFALLSGELAAILLRVIGKADTVQPKSGDDKETSQC